MFKTTLFLLIFIPHFLWAATTTPPCPALFEKGLIKLSFSIHPEKGKLQFEITESKDTTTETINSLFNFLTRAVLNPVFDLKTLDLVMKRFIEDKRDDATFYEKLKDAFKITVHTNNPNIPSSGPVAFVMNHPLSGLEAIALASQVSKVRPDVKFVATSMLGAVPAMNENAFFINLSQSRAAKQFNLNTTDEIKEHLKKGGAIIILPVGEVTKKEKLSDAYALEKRWKWTLAKIISENPLIDVVPVFAEGQPSQVFQVAKKINEGFGTLFILRELAKGVNSKVDLTYGSTVKGEFLNSFNDSSYTMEYLRSLTYSLKNANATTVESKKMEKLLSPLPAELIEADLSKANVIFDFYPDKPEKGIMVYAAQGKRIRTAMNEVGRLRELTFRTVGEGTGKHRDLDEFDNEYVQLVAWDKSKKQICGGYRIAKVDTLTKVYTDELFDLTEIRKIGKVLELGRSFVHPDYQKRSLTLPALWRAIGQFLIQNPEYKYMMGPVSISNAYKESSKQLIIEFLKQNYMHELRAKGHSEPVFSSYLTSTEIVNLLKAHPTLDSLSDLIKKIEGDPSKGIPVLIPLYIKMGNRFMGFNFDASFNSIDGMILTDFTKMPLEELKKYMDEEEARKWLGSKN